MEQETEMEQQAVIIEGNKEKLPKYTLPRGERLYISREELTSLHDKYFETLSVMKEGEAIAPAELRSLMESVITLSYAEEIERLRLRNMTDSNSEYLRVRALNEVLTPQTRRGWFFRKKRNQAQILLDELVRRQAALALRKKADELPAICKEENGEEEPLPFELAFADLKELLPRMRKKRAQAIAGALEHLFIAFGTKHNELVEVKTQLAAAKANISELVKSIKEQNQSVEQVQTEPTQIEQAQAVSTQAEPAEEVQADQVETPPADGVYEEGLDYDELEESEE